jgi:hypothetical protein
LLDREIALVGAAGIVFEEVVAGGIDRIGGVVSVVGAIRRRRAIRLNRWRLLAGLAGIAETGELRKTADEALNTVDGFAGKLADALEHRTGTGREVERVEAAQRLLHLLWNLGEPTRRIVEGVADLIGEVRVGLQRARQSGHDEG